jgi:hypothetical protein
LVSMRPMSSHELARIAQALEAAGIVDLTPGTVIFSKVAAQQMGRGNPVHATIVANDVPVDARDATPKEALEHALNEARARGAAFRDELLTDPEMLNTAELADRLDMSEEGIRLKRKRHEVLGLEFAKRGIRYPSWQVMEDRQLLPALPRLFAILGDDPWRVYRFLLQHHPEIGGERAVDALKRGRLDGVLAAAENTAAGAFS